FRLVAGDGDEQMAIGGWIAIEADQRPRRPPEDEVGGVGRGPLPIVAQETPRGRPREVADVLSPPRRPHVLDILGHADDAVYLAAICFHNGRATRMDLKERWVYRSVRCSVVSNSSRRAFSSANISSSGCSSSFFLASR